MSVEPEVSDNPQIGQVGCYSLHLYCREENVEHEYNEFPHEYVGYDRGEALKKARNNGWILHRNGEATCPKCS